MPDEIPYEIRPIGRVRSTLTRREDAPHQGRDGAPDAWIDLNEEYRGGLLGVEPGSELVVLTWLHLSDRSVLQVRPSHDTERRLRGVFATRAPVRPNPVGIHPVRVLEIEGARVHVEHLEAVDGTPVIDIKAVLRAAPSDPK